LEHFLQGTYSYAYVSDAAVAEFKAFDVLAHFDNLANGFMSRDKLPGGVNAIRYRINVMTSDSQGIWR
jgi:hypothetical protein